MRISGVRVPPGQLRWAALGTGLFLLAVALTALAGRLGLTGTPAPAEPAGRPVTATVVTATPCSVPGASEQVLVTLGGRELRARFDGCGHAEGERVEVAVPPDASGEIVVSAAQAATGDAVVGEGLGSLLLVVSSAAGAGYVFLLRRGPREGSPPRR